ncbi:hypothetical protein H920_17829 [Fukomys damarensis]|uniref:Uncharacterized protein n=1 Tax=Fukomys damarensis TaxID=885580 RepID=A0A091CRG1_FUKDA|nr:hypothetical protein H920_17829 [Fukomys damarensis]
MPIAQLLELWKKIEVEPMEIETTEEELSLDAEPTTEDTVEEVTICVLLRSGCLERVGPVVGAQQEQPMSTEMVWSTVALLHLVDFVVKFSQH